MLDYSDFSHLFRGQWSIYQEEAPSWEEMKKYLFPGMTFFDVGCQKGIFSKGVIEYLKGDCKIFAFDILEFPEIKELDKNILTFSQVALGDGNPFNCCVHWDSKTIRLLKTKMLDSLCENVDAVDFIKMDIDGPEFEALKGSEKILRKFKPKLMVEIIREFDQINSFLGEIGYENVAVRNDMNFFYV